MKFNEFCRRLLIQIKMIKNVRIPGYSGELLRKFATESLRFFVPCNENEQDLRDRYKSLQPGASGRFVHLPQNRRKNGVRTAKKPAGISLHEVSTESVIIQGALS